MPICGRFTHSVSSSVCLRVYSLQPGTAMASTVSASSNTLKPTGFNNGLSCKVCRFALQTLVFRLAEFHAKTDIGLIISIFPHGIFPGHALNSICIINFFYIFENPLDQAFKHYARYLPAATKLISQSICVNSGCRSARRSSSRKHFTIW